MTKSAGGPRRLGRTEEAAVAYELAPSEVERAFLRRRLDELTA